MVRKCGYFRNLIRIICVSVCAFCVFIVPALSSNNLPSEYTELEYIESTGTQWIDTRYAFTTEKVSIEFKLRRTGDTGATNLIGTSSGNNSEWFSLYSSTNDFYIGTSTNVFTGPSNMNVDYVLKYETDANKHITQTIDGVVGEQKTYKGTFLHGNTLCLWNDKQYFGRICPNLRYYWFKITDNDTLVRNMIPARRNSDEVVGMYDTVSNTFFTNAGTGTFVAGPAVGIQIATTKYVETAFADSVSELNTTMGTIKNVVDNTIIQADRIGKLATGKQNRPAGSCPEGRMCLLITESDGTLHWYPICGGDGSVEPFDSNAWLTSLTTAGKPTFKANQDSDSKWTYYNGFFKGIGSWRQQYADGSTSTYDRPFAHATRCTSPNYTTEIREASPCYTETGMYKTLTEGEWAVVYEGDEKASSASTPVDPGVIYGISKCVSTNLTGSVSYATKATAAQLADPLFSGIPTNQTDGADYKQCWCKMTAIGLPGSGTTTTEKAANGGIAGVSGSAWVFRNTYGSAANCAGGCAINCADLVRLNPSFRSAVVSTNN